MLRKTTSRILAMLMALSMLAAVGCSNGGASSDATGDSTDTTVAQETAAETEAETTAAPAAETTAQPASVTQTKTEPEESKSGYIIEEYSEYHYTTFVCPYTDGKGVVGGGEPNGYFDPETDEMAAFIADHPEWYKDTKLMEKWDIAAAPFGDRISSMMAADTPFISDPVNVNGLMVYKTFDITDLSDDINYTLNMFYDNTVYVYINGKPYFINDANCGSGDWNGAYDPIKYNIDDQKLTLKDFLVKGTNYIAVSIKNCWGGRELDMTLEYEKSATKASVLFFDQGTEWHYQVFACPYTDGEGNIDGSVAGGYYAEEDDMMAKFIKENPNFTTDTALLSSWPTAKAPFSAVMNEIGWTGSNHGLILYKSFEVTDLEKLKTADYFDWYCLYDNAIHVYLNGTEIFVDDGECVVQDWNGGMTHYELDTATIAGLLKQGENHIVVTIKDAWGGRDFNAAFSAEWK